MAGNGCESLAAAGLTRALPWPDQPWHVAACPRQPRAAAQAAPARISCARPDAPRATLRGPSECSLALTAAPPSAHARLPAPPCSTSSRVSLQVVNEKLGMNQKPRRRGLTRNSDGQKSYLASSWHPALLKLNGRVTGVALREKKFHLMVVKNF